MADAIWASTSKGEAVRRELDRGWTVIALLIRINYRSGRECRMYQRYNARKWHPLLIIFLTKPSLGEGKPLGNAARSEIRAGNLSHADRSRPSLH